MKKALRFGVIPALSATFKCIAFSALFCFIQLSLIAQQTAGTIQAGVLRLNQMTGINKTTGLIPTFNLRDEGIRGSKFFNERYTEGEVWLTKDRHFEKEFKYKFDEEANTIQIQRQNGDSVQLFGNEIEVAKLYIDGSTITYFRAEVPNSKGMQRLFQVLFVGKKYTLLKLPGKKMVKTENTGGYNIGEVYHEYIPTHRYFLQVGQKPFAEIKMTKRSLLKSMPHKKVALEEFFEFHEGDIQDYEIAQLLEETEK